MSELNSGFDGKVRFGPLVIDLLGALVLVHGRAIDLPPLQVRILALLACRAGDIVSKEEIRSAVFRTAQAPNASNIARHICELRGRLGPARALLVTGRDGYGIVAPQSAASVQSCSTPTLSTR